MTHFKFMRPDTRSSPRWNSTTDCRYATLSNCMYMKYQLHRCAKIYRSTQRLTYSH